MNDKCGGQRADPTLSSRVIANDFWQLAAANLAIVANQGRAMKHPRVLLADRPSDVGGCIEQGSRASLETI